MSKRIALSVLAAGIFLSGQAFAQGQAQEETHWGITGSFTPGWEASSKLIGMLTDIDRVDLRADELEIGFVRGKELGGEWGVSFSLRKMSSGSQIVDVVSHGGNDNFSYPNTDTFLLGQSSLFGVEVHKFVPFATIKNRLEIGMNFAGGAMRFSGQSTKKSIRYVFDFGCPCSETKPPQLTVSTREILTTSSVRDMIRDLGGSNILPIGKVELAVSALLARGVKLRVGGGFSFPGYDRISVQMVYLFGVPKAGGPVVASNADSGDGR